MKINGKQLSDTLRTESTPFDIVYSDRTVGDLNGAVRFTAINDTGSAIEKGKVVALVENLSGNLSKVVLADADSTSMPAFGLTAQSSTGNGDEVDVITFGNLKGIDTSTLDVGDTLYVSTTAGEYTTTAPTGSGSKIQNLGMVVKSDSNGIIKVGGAGRSNATPNLDEGHFFVGNASNESTQSAYQLPTAIGTSGQVLTSNGTNVTFQDASKSYTTSFVGDSDFNATDNTFYFVNTTSGNTTSITLPDRGTDTSLEYRFKFFNHGDGLLRIMELNNPGLIDPSEDGSTPSNIGSSYKFFNSRCLIEVFSIVGTSHYEWIVSSQLELGKETLSADGEVLRYNASTDQMVALPYTFPTSAGTSGQVLASDGTNVTFQDASSGTSYTEVTASISEADFTIQDMFIPTDASSGIVINLPTFKNQFTKALSYDGDRFIIDNKSTYTVQLRVAELSNYNSSASPSRYEQTFMRHSGNYDATGVYSSNNASGEHIYEIAPMSRVEVEVHQYINTAPSTDVYRIIYNVTSTGGMIGAFYYNYITASQTALTNNIYVCDGTFTLTLPSRDSDIGERIEVKNYGTGTITLDPDLGNINGSATYSLTAGSYVTLMRIHLGTNYWITL